METIPEPGTSIKLHGHPLEIIKRDEHAVKLVKFLPVKKPSKQVFSIN
jgi:Mg2+/Co2+ transporter CorB